MKNTIILSRMYVGRYLEKNIGHEVINLFKDDNNNNYIYISDDGKINPKYNDKVEAVLLVRYIEEGVMEIIAKAEQLEQILYKTKSHEKDSQSQVEYAINNSIKYGGVSIHDIHNKSIAEQIVITFKTNFIRKPLEPLYLIEDKKKLSLYDNYIYLPEKHFSKQSLKMYYQKDSFPEDYSIMIDALRDDSLWEDRDTTKKINLNDYDEFRKGSSFLSIIQKEYDELVISNLLAYYFEQNKNLFVKFAKDVLKIDGFSNDFEIIRETENHIDLLIRDKANVIVIENKIKSKINGERHNIYSEEMQSQLYDYYIHVKREYPNMNIKCYIFSPDYNLINLSKYKCGEYYETVNYSEIYKFYFKNAGRMIHASYFTEFLGALEKHSKTHDSSNFDVMKERFINRIKTILERNNK